MRERDARIFRRAIALLADGDASFVRCAEALHRALCEEIASAAIFDLQHESQVFVIGSIITRWGIAERDGAVWIVRATPGAPLLWLEPMAGGSCDPR